MLQKNNIILFCLLLICVACKKDRGVSVQYDVLKIDENINIHKVIFLNDSVGFACGGKQFEYGAIFKTTDKGNSWKKVYSDFTRSIYDLYFINDNNGFAGGDSILLLTTDNKGESWQSFWFNHIPRDKPQRTAFKNFFRINDHEFYIVGGQNFNAGLVFKTTNAGNNWGFNIFENELKGIYFIDSINGYVSGNGVIYKTTDAGQTYQLCNIKGDFFTSVHFNDKNNGIAVGYDGGIYLTSDAGDNWKTIVQPNKVFEKRVHFNDMKFEDNDRGYAAGTNGLLMYTDDGGSNWKLIEKFCDDNFLSITITRPGELMITSGKGKIYKVFF